MRLVAAFVLVASLAGPARADDVRVPPGSGIVPHVLYLDRCPMDCTITAGAVDDARTDTSSLIAQDATLTRMPRLDLVWADIVLCLGQVFGPYDLQIVTEEPDPATDYLEIKVAGQGVELDLFSGDPGAGPLADDCSPLDHALGFAFSNHYDLVESPTEGAAALCAAVAHQAAHMLGLEHNDRCRDLMGSASGCAERRWFTDFEAPCVECTCRSTQSSHDALLAVLGAGVEAPPPRVELRSPRDGESAEGGFRVEALVFEGRPLGHVELYVDDPSYRSPDDIAPGAGTGRYTLRHVDDGFYGYLAVEVVAFDDLGRSGGAAIVVNTRPGGCAASRGGTAWWPLLALALLLRRRRSCARAAGSRRAPRRSRRRAPAPPRAA